MSEKKAALKKKPSGSSKQETLKAYEDTIKSSSADRIEKPDEKKNAVERALERHKLEASSREEIMKSEFAGERNVFTARIEALETALQEQVSRSSSLSQQIEKAYSQVVSEQIKKASPERSSNLIVYI